MDIISMAQHARPKVMGHREFLRAQFSALSRVVVMMLSRKAALSSWSSIRAKSSGGWLISNFSESPTLKLSHARRVWSEVCPRFNDVITAPPKIEMKMTQIHFESAANCDESLARAADQSGIDREYWDIFHKRHEVSADVRRRILQSLGWDISSFESIEAERYRRFEQSLARGLDHTLVISQSELMVPLNLPSPTEGPIRFEILLEDGQRAGGSIEPEQLRATCNVKSRDRDWCIYELRLPAEIPLGYHTLKVAIGDRALAEGHLIVCPERAYLPDHLAGGGRTAGFNVALYGLRSDRNWGCGDFTDLCGLIDWARNDVGFSFIGLNPLHALHNRVPYNTSPYLPLSMFYKNLIYIDVERVAEFKTSACAQRLLASQSFQEHLRRLRESEFVEYQEVSALKRRFLKVLFREFRRRRAEDPSRVQAFAAYCEQEGELLDKFALYCALDEVMHKQDRNRWIWRDWPSEYHSPDSAESKEFAVVHRRLVDFYKYVQFVLEEQLAAAQVCAKEHGMPIGLYHDLAVATDSWGSDLWSYRDYYVHGCRVGAPPDDFSPDGQDWAFPPPDKVAHRDSGYRLYRESIRKIVRHGGALRIDHVMRLFRLFWIPEGVSAAQGTYVRDNARDLMRILALESQRSRNIVIGEDLGTVTDEIREMLSRFGILSYRLFYFEKHEADKSFKRSNEYERQALVSSATHDLPTLAGFWTGRDIEARRAAGLIDDAAYWGQKEDRKREKQRMLDTLHSERLLPEYYDRNAERISEIDGDLHNAVIGFLAQVRSMILLLNQEDFTKETHQQNLPGSTAQYPNWQRKMRVKIEELRSPVWKPFAAMFRNQLMRTERQSY